MANGKWQMANRVGYTLIELLVGISVIGIIFGLGFASYREFSRRQTLAQAASDFRSNLRLAQQKALAGEKPKECKGEFFGYRVSAFSLTFCSYDVYADCKDSDGTKKSASFCASGVTATASTAQTILFKPLGQGTSLTTDQKITFKHAQGGVPIDVIVTPAGEIR